MLEFTFRDHNGVQIWVSVQQLSATCKGGCCFDRAVADFRAHCDPNFVPGSKGVSITTKGI